MNDGSANPYRAPQSIETVHRASMVVVQPKFAWLLLVLGLWLTVVHFLFYVAYLGIGIFSMLGERDASEAAPRGTWASDVTWLSWLAEAAPYFRLVVGVFIEGALLRGFWRARRGRTHSRQLLVSCLLQLALALLFLAALVYLIFQGWISAPDGMSRRTYDWKDVGDYLSFEVIGSLPFFFAACYIVIARLRQKRGSANTTSA